MIYPTNDQFPFSRKTSEIYPFDVRNGLKYDNHTDAEYQLIRDGPNSFLNVTII